MAHLAAERLGNVEGAIEGWKRVLDLRGEDPEALGALAGLYEQQSKWAELTDVLERHFDIAESDEDRVNVLTRRARLFSEQLNRDDEALETWQRVLDIDFSNVAALRATAQVARSRQDPNELVSALHATIDRAAALLEAEELKGIYRELGKTYGAVLAQPFDAAEAWRHLLEVDPTDFEGHGRAGDHLPRRRTLGRGDRRQDATRERARGPEQARARAARSHGTMEERGQRLRSGDRRFRADSEHRSGAPRGIRGPGTPAYGRGSLGKRWSSCT